jgi:hypothetical protein
VALHTTGVSEIVGRNLRDPQANVPVRKNRRIKNRALPPVQDEAIILDNQRRAPVF